VRCQEATNAMHSILDDPTDPVAENVYAHMDLCTMCEEHFQSLHDTIQKVRELEWLEAPDTILTNVMAHIAEENRPRGWLSSPGIRKWGGWVAASVALAFIGGVYWSQPDYVSVITSSRNGNLNITKHAVIVPAGSEYKGDLTISNGDVIVHGKVDGDVTALNGRVILASGADIKGRTQEVHAFWQWVQYYFSKIWNTIVKWF
jgi:hypothetical protein